jgi:hypothetical protein
MGYYVQTTDRLHEQATPASTWTINHNLGAHPVVDVYILQNSTYEKIIPMEVNHVTANQATIVFSQPFAGYARVR